MLVLLCCRPTRVTVWSIRVRLFCFLGFGAKGSTLIVVLVRVGCVG